MTRIIAGRAGGRPLQTPPGRDTRPTSDRTREALFSTLEARLGSLAGLRVLDLYAGSGAVALEALSRGAAYALMVESARPALRVLRANVATLGLPGAQVQDQPVERVAAGTPAGAAYDLAFLDPPYAVAAEQVAAVVTRLVEGGWLAPGALVVVERSSRDAWQWPPDVEPVSDRRYGETTLWYARVPGSAAEDGSRVAQSRSDRATL